MSDEYEELEDVEVLRTTDRAVLVYYDDAGEEEWIPRSAIEGGDDVDAGHDGPLLVKAWKLRDLGWTA